MKPAVLAKLAALIPTASRDRHVDLRPFVRTYVSALGRVHLAVRSQLASEVAVHDSVILDAITRYTAVADEHGALGLAVMELNEQELLEGRRPTFVAREPIDRRKRLELRNHLPAHFDTQVVTNEIVR